VVSSQLSVVSRPVAVASLFYLPLNTNYFLILALPFPF
jgi:hypothetical protein